MKPRFILLSALLYTGALAGAEPPSAPAAPASSIRTFSSLDRPQPGEVEETFPAGTLAFESATAHEVLQVHIVELKNQRANSIVPMLQPFARMPNSIVTGGDGNNLLILRDYSVNVRRMLLVIERLEREPPVRELLAPPKRRPAGVNAPPP